MSPASRSPTPRRPSTLLLVLAASTLAATALAEAPAPTPAPTPAPALVRRTADVPAYPIAAGKGTASIFYDATQGSADAALTVLVLQPGAAVPEHTHATSVELLYILEGQAEMTIAGQLIALGPGDATRIPIGAAHAAKVVGDRPLRAVQVYTPAGPEQRFRPKP